MMENIGIAFLYTLIAGLSTGIGGIIAFFTKQTNTKFLSVVLGFSAGIGLIMLIDRCIPCYENPHEIKRVEDITSKQSIPKKRNTQCKRHSNKCLNLSTLNPAKLKRIGILMAACYLYKKRG